MMNCGVYTITSPSGKQYVGSTQRFSDRWYFHKYALRRGKHQATALQNAWNKYGEDGLIFAKLLICSKANLLIYEQRALDVLKPKYNTVKLAGKGRKQTPESVAKRAAALRGHSLSAEHRQKIANTLKGNVPHNKGGRHTEATKAKMKAASQIRWDRERSNKNG